MRKQVYELTAADLREHREWFFPMDESVEDEMTVRPVDDGATPPQGLATITRCMFRTANGIAFEGYLYPDDTGNVELLKPVMWVTEELTVTFWNGITTPSTDYLERIAKHLPAESWPIQFETDPTAKVRASGALRGIYFLGAQAKKVECVGPSFDSRRVTH